MKKVFYVPLIVFLVFSCTVTNVPLKGTYEKPTFETSKSVDEVWTNIIDFFASNGISIKIIDKESGLIISEGNSFKDRYTYEKADGSLFDKSAYIVLNKISYGGEQQKPQIVTGEWNIRIKPLNGRTSVAINLVNIEASAEQNFVFTGKSTGEFEKFIFEQIK